MCLNTLCILLCTLELSAEGSQIEQICTFKLLGVTINNTLAGLTTSTWSVPRCPQTSVSFAIFHGFFCSLFFFSSLYLIFSFSSTVTLCGPGTPRLRLPGWRPSSTSYMQVWRPGENFTLLLPCSTVHLQSPLLIYLSFFLRLHSTTTPAPLCLPSSTFHLINLIFYGLKSFSFMGEHCGDPCHRTSETLKTSLAITHHFLSNISINDIWLLLVACAWYFPDIRYSGKFSREKIFVKVLKLEILWK